MIRTARILAAGLLHLLAARIDVYDTYLVELNVEDALLDSDAIVRAINAHARMN